MKPLQLKYISLCCATLYRVFFSCPSSSIPTLVTILSNGTGFRDKTNMTYLPDNPDNTDNPENLDNPDNPDNLANLDMLKNLN